MVFRWASSRLLVLLYIFSLTVLVLLFHQSVKPGQVSCIRAITNLGSLSPVPVATFCRLGRERVGIPLGYRRLLNHSNWPRNGRAGNKFAAALRNEAETLRSAASSHNEDEKLLSDWRFPRRLLSEGGNNGREGCLAKVNECPAESLSSSIAQVKHVHAGVWPHFSAALAAGVPGGGWYPASDAWQRRAKSFGLNVYYKEAGGGGDCMYHAIAASLTELAEDFPELKGLTAQTVRNAAAVAFIGSKNLAEGKAGTQQEERQFMENLGILAALEEGGSWEDKWSPASILKKNEYVNSAGQKMPTDTVPRKAQALYFELSRCGPSHLGTDFDLAPLQNALNVGFIVLHERGHVYAMGADATAVRPVYSLIYFRQGGHFQVAGIGNKDTGIRSAFRTAEVPDFLQCIHIVDCHSPVYPTGALALQEI